MEKDKIKGLENYQYGFKDEDTSVFKTKKGLTRDTILTISKIKNEPEWMKEFRLKSFETFLKMKNPNKQIIKDTINKITIDKNKKVKIYFNFNLNGEV